MSNWSDDEKSCRVDFFKESGKWYAAEAVVFDDDLYEKYGPDAFEAALVRHLKGRLSGMTAMCLNPYVTAQYPLMIKVP